MPEKSTTATAAAERFGKILREFRLSHRLKAREVGAFVGLNHDTVLKYERGEREPNILTLILFSRLFGVSIDRLIVGVNHTITAPSFSSADHLKNIVVVRDRSGGVTYIGPERRGGKKRKFKGNDQRIKNKLR